MCGIVGYFEKKKNINDTLIIEAMNRLIHHRGPDDSGVELLPVFYNHNMAMGFTRLSILDLTNAGHQPMFNAKRNICISFNGEIFNAFLYKDSLRSKGYVFKTKTDTELLLYLYEEYGLQGMLERINGMFSIAICDMRINKLYLIRDRVGVKPLYYYSDNNLFMYASEVKAFYAHPQFVNTLNEDRVKEYLMFRYVAGKETLLCNVYNVLPGHYIEIDDKYHVNEREYWTQPGESTDVKLRLDEWEKLISKSVNNRLLSDAPIGVQLSGGIDSSIVSAYAQMYSKEKLGSYSVVFENEKISEKKWIDIAAEICGITEKNMYICGSKRFVDRMRTATWYLDFPINHPNSIAIMQMCQGARNNGIKVLLTGEGADELFGGYSRYSRFLWSQEHPKLRKQEDREKGIVRYWNTRVEEFIASSAFFKPAKLQACLLDHSLAGILNSRYQIYDECTGADLSANKLLNYEMKTYLVDILNRQDKTSMAASIETRVPYLDYTLIEAVRRQNHNTYLQGVRNETIRYTKKPLKKLSKRLFGDEFTYRPKSGFPLPLNEYFNNEKELVEYSEDELLPTLYSIGIFDRNIIESDWTKRGQMTHYEFESGLWILLSFALWKSIFLGNKMKVTHFK